MQEALTLFDSICNSRWFVKTSIVRARFVALLPYPNVVLDSVLEQDRLVRGEAATVTTWRLLPRLHGWRQLRRCMRLPLASFRVAQPVGGDEANLRALHVCNGYAAD